jgi:hypothetical protein
VVNLWKGELIFKNSEDISLYAYGLFVLRDFINCSISFVVVHLHLMVGYGLLKACSIKWVWMSILLLSFLLIKWLFLLCLLIFPVIATKYSLKVSTIVCWSIIFLPSMFTSSSSSFSRLLFIVPQVVLILLWEFRINLSCSILFAFFYNHRKYSRVTL